MQSSKVRKKARRQESGKNADTGEAQPIRVGLTGNIGSGKSTASSMFAELGVPVFDADSVGHSLLASSTHVQKMIIEKFGKEIVFAGSIDRHRLAKIVFSDPRKKKTLEDILHPQIMNSIIGSIPKRSGSHYVVVEVPLLYEARLSHLFDYVIVVKAATELSVERASRNLGVTKSDILNRLSAQLDQSQKEKLADFVISNDGSLDELRSRVVILHKIISSLNVSDSET